MTLYQGPWKPDGIFFLTLREKKCSSDNYENHLMTPKLIIKLRLAQKRKTQASIFFNYWFLEIPTFLYASHTRMNSCRSFPSGVYFGTTSQNTSKSFLIMWSWLGMTNRMIVMSSDGIFSPFKIICMTFFRASIFVRASPFSAIV